MHEFLKHKSRNDGGLAMVAAHKLRDNCIGKDLGVVGEGMTPTNTLL